MLAPVEAHPRILSHYIAPNGQDPLQKWITGLRDWKGKSKIMVRLDRVKDGNFGQRGSVGDGVHELKIDSEPGYRVYYGLDGDDKVILLGGGDKDSQDSDIRKAQERWEDYSA